MAIFLQTYRTARCEEPAVGGAKFVLRTVRRETGQGGFSSLESALRFEFSEDGRLSPVWVAGAGLGKHRAGGEIYRSGASFDLFCKGFRRNRLQTYKRVRFLRDVIGENKPHKRAPRRASRVPCSTTGNGPARCCPDTQVVGASYFDLISGRSTLPAFPSP